VIRRTLLVHLRRIRLARRAMIQLIPQLGLVLLVLDGHQVANRGARVDRIGLARIHGAPHGGAKRKRGYRVRSCRDHAAAGD